MGPKVMGPTSHDLKITGPTQTLQTALGPSKPKEFRPQTPPYEGGRVWVEDRERLHVDDMVDMVGESVDDMV